MSTVSTDPIADMLTRIRNAIAVRKNEISLSHSKIKESVVKLLKDNSYIDSYNVEDQAVGKTLNIVINNDNNNARITEIVRISKPGRRIYAGNDNIPIVRRGRGIVILSTSRGMMTGGQARQKKIGGEVICRVY